MDEAIEIAAALCRRFEGCILAPYLDAVGVPTIGYGTTRYPDGRRVTMRDNPITLREAEALMFHHLRVDLLPEVLRLCPGIDTEKRLAAILDWTYNLGSTNLAASTLRKRINAGQWEDVPAQLRRWVYAGGKVLPGLVRRRDAEALLIL